MIKPSRKPYGYRDLLVYKKAEALQSACAELTHQFPRTKTLMALADQMDRSGRSTKQNIVEGWKRNSTNEYYEFLGFSIGANTELEEDCDDICKGMYPELMGVRGVMGERGIKGLQEMGGKGEMFQQDRAREGESVRVQAGGWQADEHVAGMHLLLPQHPPFLHHSHDRSGDVVF